jgi:phospholipid transport system substrate-binding protein
MENAMMSGIARSRFVALIALACLCAGGAAAAPGPADIVGHFDDVLLDTMRNAAALGIKGRYEKLAPVVLTTFDVPFMTRVSIGPLWAKASSDEKQRAAKAFARYITATYANRFDDYSGEKFEVLGEQRLKHGTLVRSQIVKSDGEKVAINYMLHDNDTAWQIRDIYLSGTISELATRRSDFISTLRSGGIAALIVRLNQKADDLLAQ